MGRFGDAYAASLQAHRPEEYARLRARGQLSVQVAHEEVRGQRVFQDTLAGLLSQNPPPHTYLERVQHLQVLENQATELALEEVVVRPDSDAPDVDIVPPDYTTEST